MPKAYSLDLRERVARFVEDGHSRRAAAAHFEVSVSFVVNLMKAYRTTGRLKPSLRPAPHRDAKGMGLRAGQGRQR
jgi:transposase